MKKTRLHLIWIWVCTICLVFCACAHSTAPEAETSSSEAPAESESSSEAKEEESAEPAEEESTEPAQEESASPETNDFTYETNADGSLTLTAYTGNAEDLKVPSQIDGSPVTAIGPSCFAGLLCLKRVTVAEGITSIGDYAFECCGRLKKIYLPDSLQSIGDGVFSGCVNLMMVDLQEGLESIGRGAFLTCTSLVFLDLPASLTEIGAFACSGCHTLASVVFNGDAVTSLPDRVFYDCPALATIQLSSGISSVGKRAFAGCQSLRSLYFGTPLTQLGAYAFAGCSSLSSIDFEVSAIEEETFAGCEALTYINLHEGLSSIGYRAFMSSGITDLTLPASLTEITEGAFANSPVHSIILEENPNFTLIDSSLYTADGKTLLCYLPVDPYAEEPVTDVVVPEGVETISGYAFSSDLSVSHVTLPDSVTTVRAYAFSDSAVSEVEIPEGANVDPDAFLHSAMEEPEEEEEEVPAQEESEVPETIGSVAGEKSLFNEADFADYITISNEEFPTWSEKYLDFLHESSPIDQELIPYIMMYKGEVIPHYMAMTYVQNHDPYMGEQAANQFGDDFEETYIMMDHGLSTELKRGKMCDNLILYSGVYDSQLMAAAGTDTVPTQEQLVDAIGTTFTDPIMISTTTDIEIACNFSDTLFIIYASKDAMNELGAVSIDSFIYTAENEILMRENAQYRVLDVGTMAVETGDPEEEPVTIYRNYVTVELLGAGD